MENDPTFRDQIDNLGCIIVSTFGNFLVPILVAVHTANILDFWGDKSFQNKTDESD